MKFYFFILLLISPIAFSQKLKKLNIEYSKNVETLALLFNLSEAGESQFKNNPEPRATLSRLLTKKFESYKNHEAVKTLNRILNLDLVDSYDIDLAIYQTELPEYKQFAEFPSVYYEHDSLSKHQIDSIFTDFNLKVAQFYKDSNLELFFNKEDKKLYSKIKKEIHLNKFNKKQIQILENYYGIKNDYYNILFSAISFNGIGRSKTIHFNNKTTIYQLITSNPEEENIQTKLYKSNFGYSNNNYFKEIGIHEMIHSFFYEALRVNSENKELITEINYLFTNDLKQKMNQQGYLNWEMCFEEHLVRLGEIKLAEKMGNTKFLNFYRKDCIERRGFVYLELFESLFDEYENNRNLYPTIDSYIPKLVEKILKQKM